MKISSAGKYLVLILLSLVCSCESMDNYFNTPEEKYTGKAMMLPSGPYYIKNEDDYRKAMIQCGNAAMHQNRTDTYCRDELRWQREYGELKFLGPEKQQPIFHE